MDWNALGLEITKSFGPVVIALIGVWAISLRRRRFRVEHCAHCEDVAALEKAIGALEEWRGDIRVELNDLTHAATDAGNHAKRVEAALRDLDSVVERELHDLKARLEAVLERLYQLRSGRPSNGERP